MIVPSVRLASYSPRSSSILVYAFKGSSSSPAFGPLATRSRAEASILVHASPCDKNIWITRGASAIWIHPRYAPKLQRQPGAYTYQITRHRVKELFIIGILLNGLYSARADVLRRNILSGC